MQVLDVLLEADHAKVAALGQLSLVEDAGPSQHELARAAVEVGGGDPERQDHDVCSLEPVAVQHPAVPARHVV